MNQTFIKSVRTVWQTVANPPLGHAGILVVAAGELVAGLAVQLEGLAVFLVAVVKAVGVAVAVPDVRDAEA